MLVEALTTTKTTTTDRPATPVKKICHVLSADRLTRKAWYDRARVKLWILARTMG